MNEIDNKKYPLELNTMPGFAGSSAYYLRYMDPHNNNALVSHKANRYWENVDLYVGGTEHATGHLIYSRFWNKFLFDIGVACKEEPFKKLINQGMIQGRSNFVYRQKGTNTFISLGLIDQYDVTPIHVDVNMVDNDILDIEQFRQWRPEFANAELVLENGKYICGYAVEKMSKSMFNVVTPDYIIEKYGADTLRLYEMFLGPLEQSKPWDTKGIDGISRFLRKLWRLYFNNNTLLITDSEPSDEALKTLHKMLKKVSDDIERFSFNTAVSAMMICVNELTELKCNNREILEPLLIAVNPFAPHVTEELWHLCGNSQTIINAEWPEYNEQYLIENTFEYPVSFNGKVRFKYSLPSNYTTSQIEDAVINSENVQKYLSGSKPRKIIVVHGKIVNIVV